MQKKFVQSLFDRPETDADKMRLLTIMDNAINEMQILPVRRHQSPEGLLRVGIHVVVTAAPRGADLPVHPVAEKPRRLRAFVRDAAQGTEIPYQISSGNAPPNTRARFAARLIRVFFRRAAHII